MTVDLTRGDADGVDMDELLAWEMGVGFELIGVLQNKTFKCLFYGSKRIAGTCGGRKRHAAEGELHVRSWVWTMWWRGARAAAQMLRSEIMRIVMTSFALPGEEAGNGVKGFGRGGRPDVGGDDGTLLCYHRVWEVFHLIKDQKHQNRVPIIIKG